MFDRRFFASKLGLSALASLAAMLALTAMAATHQLDSAPPAAFVTGPLVELA